MSWKLSCKLALISLMRRIKFRNSGDGINAKAVCSPTNQVKYACIVNPIVTVPNLISEISYLPPRLVRSKGFSFSAEFGRCF